MSILTQTTRTIGDVLQNVKEIYKITFIAWWKLIKQLFTVVFRWVSRISIVQLVFMIWGFGTSMMALFPWISYQINLGELETISIGSRTKIFYLLPFAFALLHLFTGWKHTNKIFYASYIVSVLLYLLGLFFANPLHTTISLPSDFSFTLWLKLFGPFHIFLGLISLTALRTPIFHISDFLKHLEKEYGQSN